MYSMSPVVDPQQGVDDAVGQGSLADTSVSSTLGEHEQARFVFLKRRGNVTVDREGTIESYSPGRGYRIVTVVTDVRVLVAVGGAENGDRLISIPLSTLSGIETGTKMIGGRLILETERGATWTIPCTDEPRAVVGYLEEAKRAWSHADRLAAEVDNRLEAGRERLDEGDFQGVLSATDEAEELMERGRQRLKRFEMGEAVAANAEFESRHEASERLRRRAQAFAAEQASTEAHSHWDADRYREAANRFLDAITALERAAELSGTDPSDERLEQRLSRVRSELGALSKQPLSDAESAAASAMDRPGPVERAAGLSTAIDRYREVLSLSWGPSADFVGDSDEIRQRIRELGESLVAARVTAARRSVAVADRLAADDHEGGAHTACDTAEAHLERARAVTTELLPALTPVVDSWLTGVEEQRERIDQPLGDAGADAPTVDDERSRAQPEPFEKPSGTRSASNPDAWTPLTESTSERRREAIADLDEHQRTRLVASLWQELGWETTAFTRSADQYDVLATREGVVTVTALVWTVDSASIETVDRCAAGRMGVSEADLSVLVTTSDPSSSVRDQAEERNVKLVDADALAECLDAEGLDHLVDKVDN